MKKKISKAKKPAAKKAAKVAAKKKATPKKKAARPRAPEATGGRAPGAAWIAPYLYVADAKKAIEFYERAFGFKTRYTMPGPDGSVMHAEMEHQGQPFMLGPACEEQGTKPPSVLGGTPVALYVYVKDADAAFARATSAGAKVIEEPQDAFWGDRMCSVEDPDRHSWTFATHRRQVSPQEMAKALKTMIEASACGGEDAAHECAGHDHPPAHECGEHEHPHE